MHNQGQTLSQCPEFSLLGGWRGDLPPAENLLIPPPYLEKFLPNRLPDQIYIPSHQRLPLAHYITIFMLLPPAVVIAPVLFLFYFYVLCTKSLC